MTDKKKKDWIQKMDMKKGALREQLGVKGDKKIPAKKLAKALDGKDGPLAKKRAELAKTLGKMRKK